MRGVCLSSAADAATATPFKHMLLLASSSPAGISQIAASRFLCSGEFDSSVARLVCLPKNPISPLSCSSSKFQVELEPTLEDHCQQLSDQDKSRTISIKIQLQKECSFGEQVLLIGAPSELGSWNPLDAFPMTWSDGHVWAAELDINVPLGEAVQFKFMLREISGQLSWQPGTDRVVHTRETSNLISVIEDWENVEAQQVTEEQCIKLKEGNSPVIQESVDSIACSSKEKIVVSDIDLIASNDILRNTEVQAEPDNIGSDLEAAEPELDEKQELAKGQSRREAAMEEEHPNKLTCSNYEDANENPDTDVFSEGKSMKEREPRHNDIKWGNSTLTGFLSSLGFL